MTIATRNGKIILKDGKLAEDCACCGGWYCEVNGGGACCEDGPVGSPPTCSIKPSCDCEGTGKTFKGVGSKCTAASCCVPCSRPLITWCQSPACLPKFLTASYSFSTQLTVVTNFGGYYIAPFSASGSFTLLGQNLPEPFAPCGDYGFFAGPPAGAAFNAYEFGCGITGGGNYFVRHLCRLTQVGRYDGPIGDRYIYEAGPGSVEGNLSWTFSTTGRVEFAAAASGYCYKSGTAVSSDVPGVTISLSVTDSYGAM